MVVVYIIAGLIVMFLAVNLVTQGKLVEAVKMWIAERVSRWIQKFFEGLFPGG